MEQTIDLKSFFAIMKQHLITILVSMLAGLAVAGVMTYFVIKPQYHSQTQMVVTLPKKGTTNIGNIAANLQMINTYKDLIVSDVVLDRTQKTLKSKYDLDLKLEEIKGAVSVKQSDNSQMFSIEASSTQGADAKHIANTTAQIFQKYAKNILGTPTNRIMIVSKAAENTNLITSNNKLNLLAGLVLGLLFGVSLALLQNIFDPTIKDDKFITDKLGFALLGTVPQMSAQELANTTFNRHTKFIFKKLASDYNRDDHSSSNMPPSHYHNTRI